VEVNPAPPRQVALDSTALWLSYTSRFFAWRTKRQRGQRGWLKWAMAMWVEPQLLLAQCIRAGPCGDFSDLVPLASAAASILSFDQLLADAGYDSEANHRFCRETLGVDSLIPAKKRRSVRVVATTAYRQEMVWLPGEPGEEASRRAYRQRWKAEIVMSVVKRRCGEALTARIEINQRVRRCSEASPTTSTALTPRGVHFVQRRPLRAVRLGSSP
jgi:hypothetical protein